MNSRTDIETSRFEGLSDEQQQRLSEVLDDYFHGLEEGRVPDHDAILAAHPDLADALAAYLESLEFLHDAAVGFLPSVEPGPAGPMSERELGDFRIVREIGRGGMGVVYEAWQISLNRRVALKVLPFASLLDAKQIARFRNEAQAAAQLHHPHIVPVFAVGAERGVHYYAMQYIDGQPVDQAIAELRQATAAPDGPAHHADPQTDRSLTTEYLTNATSYFRTAARLGIQAARALQTAHEIGIVHRDVKPSNLLLDGEGNLWVADFGLARCRSDANLTRTGDFVGTMRYMSPEQMGGDAHFVDHRADIYSLGVTLYELLTLKQAVRGADPATIVRQLDRDQPYRPRLWNENIPGDLENIVLKAISQRRDERYGSAEELADDLQRFLDGKPTIARRPTLADRAGKWARRHKRAVAATVGGLLLTVVALVVVSLVLANQQQRTERALAEARENYQQYRAQLALTHNHLGLLQNHNGDSRQAEASFRNAIQLQREILKEHPGDPQTLRELAATLNNLSFLRAEDDPADATRCYDEILDVQKSLVAAAPTNFPYQVDLALTYGNVGSNYLRQGKPQVALTAFGQAIEILQRVLEATPANVDCQRDLAVSFNNLGMTQNLLGQLREAEQSFRQALLATGDRADRAGSAAVDLSSAGGICNNLGMVLEKLGRLDEAAASFTRATSYQQAAADLAPGEARYRELLSKHYFNFGRVLRNSGQFEQAIDAALARREIWRGDGPRLWSVAEEMALATHQARQAAADDAPAANHSEHFVRRTMSVLREAVDLGVDPTEKVPQSKAIQALSDLPEVQAWLAESGTSLRYQTLPQ